MIRIIVANKMSSVRLSMGLGFRFSFTTGLVLGAFQVQKQTKIWHNKRKSQIKSHSKDKIFLHTWQTFSMTDAKGKLCCFR